MADMSWEQTGKNTVSLYLRSAGRLPHAAPPRLMLSPNIDDEAPDAATATHRYRGAMARKERQSHAIVRTFYFGYARLHVLLLFSRSTSRHPFPA